GGEPIPTSLPMGAGIFKHRRKTFVCCAASLSSTAAPGAPGAPSVTEMSLTTGTTMSVFGWCCPPPLTPETLGLRIGGEIPEAFTPLCSPREARQAGRIRCRLRGRSTAAHDPNHHLTSRPGQE